MRLTADRMEFESWYWQDFSLLHVDQTDYEAQPVSYSKGD
jgi:hypothetical protein